MLGLNMLDYGLVFQQPLSIANPNVHIQQQQQAYINQQQQQQNAYTDQQFVESIYFSGNDNNKSNVIHGNILVNENKKQNSVHIGYDVINNSGLDEALVGNDWSLEDFLLSGGDETYDVDVGQLSDVSSNVSSPATISTSSSIDNLFDDLDIFTPYGSPTPSISSSISSSSSCDGIVPGSPQSVSVPGSPHSSLNSPYCSPNDECFAEQLSLVEILNNGRNDSGSSSSDESEASSSHMSSVIPVGTDDFTQTYMQLLMCATQMETENVGNTNNLGENENVGNNVMDFVVNQESTTIDTSMISETICESVIEESLLPSHRYVPYKGKPRTTEQKLRKKAHNRKSASKYRSKKKQEDEEKSSELSILEAKNTSLKSNVEDLQKEIGYLKGLLVDVVKARVSKNCKNNKNDENSTENLLTILSALSK